MNIRKFLEEKRIVTTFVWPWNWYHQGSGGSYLSTDRYCNENISSSYYYFRVFGLEVSFYKRHQ
jgi:hypothetical protein